MNDFEAIKREYPLEQFIQQTTGRQLKSVGSALGMNPCPFCGHNDSFRVWTKIGAFKCYSCGESGNIFNFAKAHFKLSNDYEVLQRVASVTGYKLKDASEIKKQAPELETRQAVFNAAAAYYESVLLNDKKAMAVLSETRRYTAKDVEAFHIGYTGTARDGLLNHLKQNFKAAEIQKSGLIKKRKGNWEDFFIPGLFVFPHFRGRNVADFTIKDAQKHTKADSKDVISYRLPKEFRIGKIYFYNQDALYSDEIIIVEGEHDAIQPMRFASAKNVLAITGNPSKEALAYLKRYIADKTVYLAFDKDAAGEKYTRQFFYELWGLADSVNMLTWEGKAKDLDAFLRTVILGGLKPQTVLAELIEKSIDALHWVIKSIPDEEDLNKLMRLLDPLKKKALEINDSIQFDIALEIIRGHFKKGKSVVKFLKKQFESERLEMLNNTDYLDALPFFEKNGVYWHRHKNGDINLSNFRLHIMDRVLYNEELYYRCTLKSVAGEMAEQVEFSPAERVDSKRFRTKLVSEGAFHFTGRDNELSGIWQYEESKSKARYIYYIKQYGWIAGAENMWMFDNCAIKDGVLYPRNADTDFIAIGKKYYLPHDVLVYSGSVPRINLETVYTSDFANKVALSFHQMLDSDARGGLHNMAGYMFLGFIPATIYSNEIFKKYGFFPLLFSYGPPGTGKTHATRLLLNFFGFMAQPESWPSATVAGTYMFMQQLSCLPGWYDEFLNDKTFQNLLGTIKNIYNRVGAGKGGLGEKRIKRDVNATLWLSGEDNPANEAVLSRSVLFRFNNLNPHKNKAYKFLLDNAANLSVIVRNLLLEKTAEQGIRLVRDIETLKEYILSKSEKMDPRIALNHAIVAASLNVMNIDYPEEFHDYVVKHAERSMYFKEEENPRYLFFSELAYLYSRGQLHGVVSFDSINEMVYIRFEQAIRLIQADIRKRGENLRIKAGSIKDYLMDMNGFERVGRAYFRIGEKSEQKRCMIFNYKRLEQNIKDVLEDIIEEKEEIPSFRD